MDFTYLNTFEIELAQRCLGPTVQSGTCRSYTHFTSFPFKMSADIRIILEPGIKSHPCISSIHFSTLIYSLFQFFPRVIGLSLFCFFSTYFLSSNSFFLTYFFHYLAIFLLIVTKGFSWCISNF